MKKTGEKGGRGQKRWILGVAMRGLERGFDKG